MRNRKRKAFTLVEMLIALVIVTILGGGALAAMWHFLRSYHQLDDYTLADTEIENVIQRVSHEFALIGLGMPNNRGELGAFALSFRDDNPDRWPIMALFGPEDMTAAGVNRGWGGPVTVSERPPFPGAPIRPWEPWHYPALFNDAWVGAELYYAWSVPTGVKVHVRRVDAAGNPDTIPEAERSFVRNSQPLRLDFQPAADAVARAALLRNFGWRWTLNPPARAIGVPPAAALLANPGRDMRHWVLLPTMRLPLRVDGWNGDEGLNVTAAPVSNDTLDGIWANPAMRFERPVMEVDEIYLMQAARIWREPTPDGLGGVVLRLPFGADFENANHRQEWLAERVVALQFVYHPETSLLTMFIAARGTENLRGRAPLPTGWPAWLPEQIPAAVLGNFRVAVRAVSWRIRN